MTYKYFKESEFKCKCGRCENKINPELIKKLDTAREIAGVPFVVTSGYRCREYNNDLLSRGYKASKNSSHTLGLAADIAANDKTRDVIYQALKKAGFVRIGLGKTFIHADIDTDKPQTEWRY